MSKRKRTPAKSKSTPFDWTQFTLRIVIGAPASKVFRAWTDDAVIPKWFTETAQVEQRKGGAIHFS